MIFDPNSEETIISDADIHSKFPEVCVYKNRTLYGKVKATFIRGLQIYDNDCPNDLLERNQEGRVLLKSDYRA